MVRLLLLMVVPSQLLLAAVAVAAAELVDATCGVDEFLFAGEEGVGAAGDFKLYEGIFFTVDFDCLTGSYSRAGDENLFVRHVFESHLTVVGRMDVFFHFNFLQLIIVLKYLDRSRSRRIGGAKLQKNLQTRKFFNVKSLGCGLISTSSAIHHQQ